MKRLFAIVVLGIFLLNVLGYYGVLLGMKAVAGDDLTERLNSDMYDLGASITFKVPLAVPYGVDSKAYENVSGEFEKDGQTYRLVKQRMYQDTLYIVCMKDEKTSRINNALEDFVQSFAGHDDDEQKSVVPSLIKDFVDTHISLTTFETGWEEEVIKVSVARNLFDSYFASIIHPPDRTIA